MMNETIEKAQTQIDLIKKVIDSKLKVLNTSNVGEIKQIYEDKTADIEILVKNEGEEFPILANVNLLTPQNEVSKIEIESKIGDLVMIFFPQRELTKWFKNKQSLTLQGTNKFTIASAVVMPLLAKTQEQKQLLRMNGKFIFKTENADLKEIIDLLLEVIDIVAGVAFSPSTSYVGNLAAPILPSLTLPVDIAAYDTKVSQTKTETGEFFD